MAGTRPHSHRVGEHFPNASTRTEPPFAAWMTICLTLFVAALVLTQVPTRADDAPGGTGLADAGAANAVTAVTTARPRTPDSFANMCMETSCGETALEPELA